jgi:HAD superfamily hydrolase (TIGR01549 family)
LIGMGGDKVLPEVTGLAKDTPEGEQISKRRKEIFSAQYLPTLKAFPQTHELLQHMHDSGLKLVIASSAEKDELQKLLEIAGADGLIEEQASSSDARQSKPDPDIVQAALNNSGLEADEVVMVGDTPYDVEASSKAGVKTIALECGGWKATDLQGALAVYASPADLLEHYDDSPLGPGPVGG